MQDLTGKTTGSTLTAVEWNQLPQESQNIITQTGQTLTDSDLNQLGKGVASYAAGGAFYTDSGAADAYVLTTVGGKQAPAGYFDGMTVEFITTNANTGASTVNVASLGVKDVKVVGGTDPTAGAVNGRTVLKFDAVNDWFELQSIKNQVVSIDFTVGAVYNPPANVTALEILAIGGGGGGGGADGQGAGTNAAAAGGGGGGAAMIVTNIIDASYTITIGAGGNAGAGSGGGDGGDGGNTTVVSSNVNLSANGGTGGQGDVGSSGSPSTSTGGAGGDATGGTVNITGSDGSSGKVNSGLVVNIGDSGGSYYGGAIRGRATAAGGDGLTVGSGGSGAGAGAASTNFPGGAGADGYVLIKEYF